MSEPKLRDSGELVVNTLSEGFTNNALIMKYLTTQLIFELR